MRRAWLGALFALLLAGAACAQDAEVVAARVEQPRPFGHFIGDLLTQRVLLERNGQAFEPAALPQAARVGGWLERRPGRIESGTDGRRWLVVEHQIVNAPRDRAVVTLPAWALHGAVAGVSLEIPAWSVNVGSLASAASAPEAAGLRADRLAPPADTDTPRRRALALAAACGLTLLAWAAWWAWRNRRAAAQRPFARAWRELRSADDSAPQAWQAMHQAFDRTAGRVLHGGTLAALFATRPEFEPMRDAIERFYAQSGQRFFRDLPAAEGLPLRGLCRDLRRIERRHER